MTNLKLNNYGVQEMNVVEMREINGGGVSILVIEGWTDGWENTEIWLLGIKIKSKKGKE